MYSFGTLKCSFLRSVYDKDTMDDFKFSTEEKIFIVMYCGGRKNAEVIRLFAAQYPDTPKSVLKDHKKFSRVINQFLETGSVLDKRENQEIGQFKPRGYQVANDSLIDDQEIENIKSNFENHPTLSFRKREEMLNRSHSTLVKISRQLGFYSFKPRVMQLLTDKHVTTRNEFCKTLIKQPDFFTKTLKLLWFSDESVFNTVNQHVNSQNTRYLSTGIERVPSDFHALLSRVQKPKSVHIWGAIFQVLKIHMAIFFEIHFFYKVCMAYGMPLKIVFLERLVDQKYYKQIMINHFFNGHSAFDAKRHFYQQDDRVFENKLFIQTKLKKNLHSFQGAPAHRAKTVISYLRDKTDDKLMALGAPDAKLPEWPSRSPDLSPCDFWLWNRLKTDIQNRKEGWPKDIPTMKLAIQAAAASIPQNDINNAILHFEKRVKRCKAEHGNTFEHKY